MKKVLFIICAAALVLASCAKSETVVKETTPGEISLMGYTGSLTKTGEMEAGYLPHNWGIYTRVTQRNSSNVIENPDFFSGEKIFGIVETTDADAPGDGSEQYKNGTYDAGSASATNNGFTIETLYWPFGGARLDFLAYSLPFATRAAAAAGSWLVNWDNPTTDVASQYTITSVDTYDNQADFLYAAANGQTTAANAGAKTVKMEFNHAQALLAFNVRTNVAGKIKIHEIAFVDKTFVTARQNEIKTNPTFGFDDLTVVPTASQVTLKTIGTLKVNNERNNMIVSWIYDTDEDGDEDEAYEVDNYAMPAGTGKSDANSDAVNFNPYGTAVSQVTASKYDQLGDVLLIPQQDKVNFTITYEVGNKLFTFTYNDLRGVWQMGNLYVYNLDFTLNEIIITEEVNPFTTSVQNVPLS